MNNEVKEMKNPREAKIISALSLNDESGKAIAWAILLCLIVITAYFNGGSEYLQSNFSPMYVALILLSAVTVCLFALGCGLHLLVTGDQSNRELRKNLREQLSTLTELEGSSEARIHDIEMALTRNLIGLTPRGLDQLALARRVVRALGIRVEQLKELLKSPTHVDLIAADELLRSKLVINENCMESLIGAEPVPPLPQEEWIPTIERLFKEIEAQKKRYA